MSAGRQALRVGIVVIAATFASEASAALPRVTATAKPPLVAAAGDKISVKATIAGTGAKVPVGFVFGTPSGSAKKGVSLGPGINVSHRWSKQLTIPGKVPAGVETGKLGSLLVCVNPAAAIKGQAGLCKKAAAIATSGTSTEERIAGAELAGRITNAQAVLYGLLGLRGDPGFRRSSMATWTGPGELGRNRQAGNAFGTLPTQFRRRSSPYFVVPQAGGSSWRTPGRDYTPIPRAAGGESCCCRDPRLHRIRRARERHRDDRGGFPLAGHPDLGREGNRLVRDNGQPEMGRR